MIIIIKGRELGMDRSTSWGNCHELGKFGLKGDGGDAIAIVTSRPERMVRGKKTITMHTNPLEILTEVKSSWPCDLAI